MAKNCILVFCFLFIVLFACTTVEDVKPVEIVVEAGEIEETGKTEEVEKAEEIVKVEISIADRIAEIFWAEVGVRELTGRNDGHRVEEYLAAANRKKGDAWCAAFITWVFKQAGVKAVVSGWSPDWFPANKTIYIRGSKTNRTPDRADVLGIYFQNLKRIAHVGFIDKWGAGNFCISIEGNTNDTGAREGDGVYVKRRLKSQIYKVSRWI